MLFSKLGLGTFLNLPLANFLHQSAMFYFVSDCKTVKNEKCVFPFKYKNQLYTGCISLDHPEKKLWCSTKNTAEGTYETWDECSPSCSDKKDPAKSLQPASSNYDIVYGL